jgi:hypothetical protein
MHCIPAMSVSSETEREKPVGAERDDISVLTMIQ